MLMHPKDRISDEEKPGVITRYLARAVSAPVLEKLEDH